jgi:chaperonin cofactor prefoldin
VSDDPILTALALLETKLDTRFNTLEVRMDRLEKNQFALMDRFDRLQRDKDDMREQIEVQRQTTQTLLTTSDALYRRIMRLQTDVDDLRDKGKAA